MSTIKVSAIQDLSGGQNVNVPNAAKAWVNFNGTGTVAIRTSFNVSSITDVGSGNYQLNFTNTLPSADYTLAGGSCSADPQLGLVYIDGTSKVKTASACKIRNRRNANSTEDETDISAIIFI